MLRRPWLFALLFLAVTFTSPAQQVDASNTGGPFEICSPMWGGVGARAEDVEEFDSENDVGIRDQDSGACGEMRTPELSDYSIHSALVMMRG